MVRNDPAYWARLRKDRRSNWAGGLAILSVMAAALNVLGITVEGAQAQARANPVYWLVLLPVVWWGSGLMWFEPGSVRKMTIVTYMAPLVAFVCVAMTSRDKEEWVISLVCAAISAAAAIGSRLAYRDSLLQREGPAR